MSYILRLHDRENGKDIYRYYVSCNDGYGMEEWSTSNIAEANRYDSEEAACRVIGSFAEYAQGNEPLNDTISRIEVIQA